MEYCKFQFGSATIILGQVIGDLGGALGNVEYDVFCQPDGSTESVSVQMNTSANSISLTIRREPSGLWLVNDKAEPGLQECMDMDIGVTPATNTLPIRRLKLAVGESRELVAAWLRFPDLDVLPLKQRYTRISEETYLYESVLSEYKAELQVDEDGVVQRYTGEWERMNDAQM